MASNGPYMTVSFPLPCGCALEQTLSVEGVLPPAEYPKFFKHAGNALQHWAEHRTQFHRCSLVSADNPAGLDREAARAAVVTDDGN